MPVPYPNFASATTSIPLSQLDNNFATTITLGNVAIQLGNVVTSLGNVTLTNTSISGLSGGAANGVVYINSSNVAVASPTVLSFTGTNLGIGTASPTNLLTLSNASGGTILEITGSGSNQANISIDNTSGNITIAADGSTGGLTGTAYSGVVGTYTNKPLFFVTNSTARASIDTSGNLNLKTSNAGIVFNNSSALTNSTLNDYETGTFTPGVGSGITQTGTVFSVGSYVKIGRMVFAQGQITTTGTFTTSGYGVQVITGLPFSQAANATYGYPVGSAFNNQNTQALTVYVANNTALYLNGGLLSTTGLFFAIAYQATF